MSNTRKRPLEPDVGNDADDRSDLREADPLVVRLTAEQRMHQQQQLNQAAIGSVMTQVAAFDTHTKIELLKAVQSDIPLCAAKLMVSSQFGISLHKPTPLATKANTTIWSILSALGRFEVCKKTVTTTTLPLLVKDDKGKAVDCGSWAQPDVAKLLSLAKPSPFGRGDQTLYDKAVRDATEITADRIQGIPQCELVSNVVFTAHKLQIYQVGGHFKPHRDTAYTTSHVMSAVMLLPTEFEGGDLVIEGIGGEQRLTAGDLSSAAVSGGMSEPSAAQNSITAEIASRRSEVALPTIAFQRDLLHRVEPVTKGVRLALQYNGDAKVTRAPPAKTWLLLDRPERFQYDYEDEDTNDNDDLATPDHRVVIRAREMDYSSDELTGFCSAGQEAAKAFVDKQGGLAHLADPLIAEIRKLMASSGGAVVLPLVHAYAVAAIDGKPVENYPLNGVDALLLQLLRQAAPDLAVSINVLRQSVSNLDYDWVPEDSATFTVSSDDASVTKATLVCPSVVWMLVKSEQQLEHGNSATPAELEYVTLGVMIRLGASSLQT